MKSLPLCLEKEFVYMFDVGKLCSKLTIPVVIPMNYTVKELTQRLMQMHGLPCHIEEDLHKKLEEFVFLETKIINDAQAEVLLKKAKQCDVDLLVAQWTHAYTQEVKQFAKPDVITNEKVFSDVYHSLIHSPALDTLLNLEHNYAIAVQELIRQRDYDMDHLEKRQQLEMDQAVEMLGVMYTDEQVNQLAQRHFENTQMIESKWASELSNLQDTQKREYKDWVMRAHAQMTAGMPMQRLLPAPGAVAIAGEDDFKHTSRMEESFTIHLGAQMKTMHNLRLVCADVLELCRHKPNTIGGILVPQPQRLQTAMSLYSNSLCGVVLLVDNRLNSYTGIKKDFASMCQQSTDFHFPELQQQFQCIEQYVIQATDWRTQRKLGEEGERMSVKSGGSSSSEKEDKTIRMQTGDFYVTRHSNLSEVHVVFHLVSDESVKSSEVSSRHPMILGYRNIIKACFRQDITTITLPLMLVHEMSEEMTIPWCVKRAELVFKCVKGFMMELATWSGQESRTIQFLVPKGLSEETFATISSMMPTIFRMSNPVTEKKKS